LKYSGHETVIQKQISKQKEDVRICVLGRGVQTGSNHCALLLLQQPASLYSLQ
jgi:hypothetical protein